MFPEDLIFTSGNKEFIFEMDAKYPFCLRKITAKKGKKQVITWHWHEELEFVYVEKGVLEYQVAGDSIRLKESEGIFINSNVMHQTVVLDEGKCEYLVFMFRSNFLAEKDSLLEKKYVLPVLRKNGLQAVALKNESSLQKKILQKLRNIHKTEEESEYGYEMILRNLCADMWISFVNMLDAEPESVKQTSPEKEERLKKMLTYIHQEYKNELSLEDIACSSGVSKRECLRCFKETINITPFNYLKKYRLEMAYILLKNTEDTVITIAESCGFHSASYFGKVFRKNTGMTPYEFRKNYRKGIENAGRNYVFYQQ